MRFHRFAQLRLKTTGAQFQSSTQCPSDLRAIQLLFVFASQPARQDKDYKGSKHEGKADAHPWHESVLFVGHPRRPLPARRALPPIFVTRQQSAGLRPADRGDARFLPASSRPSLFEILQCHRVKKPFNATETCSQARGTPRGPKPPGGSLPNPASLPFDHPGGLFPCRTISKPFAPTPPSRSPSPQADLQAPKPISKPPSPSARRRGSSRPSRTRATAMMIRAARRASGPSLAAARIFSHHHVNGSSTGGRAG